MEAITPSAGQIELWKIELEPALTEAFSGEPVVDHQAPQPEMSRFTYVPASVQIAKAEPIEGTRLTRLTVTYQVLIQEVADDSFSAGKATGVVSVIGYPGDRVDLDGADFYRGLTRSGGAG